MSVASENQVVHHCPIKDCRYSPGSERYFASKRLLNQHIGKVHAEKKYTCTKCQKGFGTNWLRKNHEIQCGRSWTCSCGVKYSSRESLWSHVRRKEHDLTDELLLTPKQISMLNTKKLASQPLVFVIQPIIQQQVSLVVPSGFSDRRIILPKQSENLVVPAELSTQSIAPKQDKSCSPGTCKASPFEAQFRSRGGKSERKQKSRLKTVAETQTCEELVQTKGVARTLESRGSQCSARVRKVRVGIESTHTQTMESAVVKMQKRGSGNRSRRKSVAVVTESEILQPTRSLWSNIEEFILPSSKDSLKVTNSSTQTSSDPYVTPNRVMCDSETATESDFLSFDWSLDKTNIMDGNLEFPMGPCGNLDQNMQVPILSEEILSESFMACGKNNPLDAFKAYSDDNATTGSSFCENTSTDGNIPLLTSLMNSCTSSASEMGCADMTQYTRSSSTTKMEEELADLDSVLGTMIGDSANFQSPLLSHSHTQTNSPLDIDYSSILANMETQTTEDFLFTDLEFSDTETQTPWEDISNISDELASNQLSIEIQTDFSVGGRCTDSTLLLPPLGKHMETQTSDIYQIPQLTNSEAQTLTASSYLFN